VHRPWVTVFETGAYLSRAEKLLSEEEQDAAIEMVARDPFCGDLIEGTGGIRKVRFAIGARGKSGGVRIIYYFHNDRMPIYFLAIFAKNEKANLSHAERNALRRLVRILKEAHGRSYES
jgi:hypothetical protein